MLLFVLNTLKIVFALLQGVCLVTGAGGFLGRHLCERLLERGYTVRAFDIRKTFDDEHIKFFVGDLCNAEVRKSLLTQCTVYCKALLSFLCNYASSDIVEVFFIVSNNR